MDYQKLENQFNQTADLREKIQYAYQIIQLTDPDQYDDSLFPYYDFICKNCHFSDFEHIRAKALEWLGNYYFFKSDFDTAIDITYEAIYLLDEEKGSTSWFNCMNLLAVIYNALGQKNKSKEVYEEIIALNPEQTKIWQNYADLLVDQKEFEKGLLCIEKGMKLCQNRPLEYLNILTSLENYYIQIKQPEKAVEIFESHFSEIEHHRGIRTKCFHFINHAESLMALNQLSESVSSIEKAIQIAETSQNKELQYFSYSMAIDIYDKADEIKKSNTYLRKLLELNTKLYASQNANKTRALEEKAGKERMLEDSGELIEKTKHMVSVGMMASGITHEINQPLNAIMIEAQTLIFKDDTDRILPNSYRQRVLYIIEAAERINAIIKHIRSNWINNDCIDKKEFEVSQTINNAISLVSQQVKAHGIILRVKLAPQSVTLYGTPISLEQSVINLIVNSMHALDTLSQKEKHITLITHIKDQTILIHLEDNGPGISKEIANKIFDPFFTQKTRDLGSGLGLTLVQNFIKDLNGKITLVKEKRKGAHFLITIPLHSNQ